MFLFISCRHTCTYVESHCCPISYFLVKTKLLFKNVLTICGNFRVFYDVLTNSFINKATGDVDKGFEPVTSLRDSEMIVINSLTKFRECEQFGEFDRHQ